MILSNISLHRDFSEYWVLVESQVSIDKREECFDFGLTACRFLFLLVSGLEARISLRNKLIVDIQSLEIGKALRISQNLRRFNDITCSLLDRALNFGIDLVYLIHCVGLINKENKDV
jgi:hypothetical protein